MTVKAKSFAIAATGGTFDFPFVPKAGIFNCLSSVAGGFEFPTPGAFGYNSVSIGFGSIDENQGCAVFADGPASLILEVLARRNASSRATFTDKIIATSLTGVASIPGVSYFIDNWDTCGISYSGSGNSSVAVLGIGGDTLLAEVHFLTLPGDGSDATLTGVGPVLDGGDPCLILGTWSQGTFDTDNAVLSFGAYANGNQFATGAQAFYLDYNGTGSFESGKFVNNATGYTAYISSLTSDGFVVTQDSAIGYDTTLVVLVLSDPEAEFAVGDSSIDSGLTVSSLSNKPEALILASAIDGTVYTTPYGSAQQMLAFVDDKGAKFHSSDAWGFAGGFSINELRWASQFGGLSPPTDRLGLHLYDFTNTSAAFELYQIIDSFNSNGFSLSKHGGSFTGDFGWVSLKTSVVEDNPCTPIIDVYSEHSL